MIGNIYDRKKMFCNLDLLYDEKDITQIEGEYGFPSIQPYMEDAPSRYIPFNEALKSNDYDCGVHFFIDDYQFERVWNQPRRYVQLLSKFKCVIAPDFSQYVDVPKAVNVWNIYRNRLLSSYWQRCGIKVIPSATWGNYGSWQYTLDGLPSCSTIAVGCLTAGAGYIFNLWKKGFDYLQSEKHPTRVIVFGNYRSKILSLPYDNIDFYEGHVNNLRSI